jgi:hypothetical protein
VGVKVSQDAPSINHLLFADDSLLLQKTDDRSANHVQHILSLYEDCSGQIINKDKSSIMFSKNARSAEKHQLMTALGINVEARIEKYLGLPVYMGRSNGENIYIFEGQGLEEDTRVEGEAAIQSWERNLD